MFYGAIEVLEGASMDNFVSQERKFMTCPARDIFFLQESFVALPLYAVALTEQGNERPRREERTETCASHSYSISLPTVHATAGQQPQQHYTSHSTSTVPSILCNIGPHFEAHVVNESIFCLTIDTNSFDSHEPRQLKGETSKRLHPTVRKGTGPIGLLAHFSNYPMA
nr:hypothetical protein CFP56_79074 [Quercus suber]